VRRDMEVARQERPVHLQDLVGDSYYASAIMQAQMRTS
jgi:hypothetical protein